MSPEVAEGPNDYPLLPENGKYFTYRRAVVMEGFDLLRTHAQARGLTLHDIRRSTSDGTHQKMSKISKAAKDFIAKVDKAPQNFTTAELALILNRSRASIRDHRRLNRSTK